MDPLPPAQIPQSVTDIMAICGLPNVLPANAPPGAPTIAEYVAAELFLDTFEKCIDTTFEELASDVKTLSANQANPLYITAGIRTKIQAFVEWTKQCFRCGFDPKETVFPVQNSVELIRQANIHTEFISKAKAMATIAKPPQFKTSDDWHSWFPLLINYLRQLPGRDGVPLSYVLRDNPLTVFNAQEQDVQEKYIQAVPLTGTTFASDTLQVHTYIANLISGNVKAEAAIQRYHHQHCGRTDWMALKAVYEGVGAFSTSKQEATKTLKTLFYAGEKGRDYNFAAFEQKLLRAFTVFEQNAAPNVIVHDNEMKIKILLEKVGPCNFLQSIASNIERDLARPNCNGLTFDQALAEIRNKVNMMKGISGSSGDNRRVQNTSSSRDRDHPYGGRGGRGGRNGGGRNNNGRGGRGGSGRGGRGRSSGSRNHPDAYNITLTNGKQLSVHPSYHFTDQEMTSMHPNDKRTLFEKRAAYKASMAQNRNISSATTQVPLTFNIPQGADAATVISAVTQQFTQAQNNNQNPPNEAGSLTFTINQTGTTNLTPFGGRNEEAARRGRHIANFHSTRYELADTRNIRSAKQRASPPNVSAANECDSNADTCCAGTNFVVLQFTNRYADVYPYNSSYAPITNVPIVSAATAWMNPENDEIVILVLHECLFYGTSLGHTLWNPNQLRHNGAIVNDNPYDTSESRMSIEIEDIVIPLHTNGTKVQFHTRTPTERELETCRHIALTNLNAWNPRDVTLGAVHTAHHSDHFIEKLYTKPIISPFVSDSLLYSCSSSGLVDLKERAISQVRISSTSA